MIHVLVADDHTIVRQGLKNIVALTSDIVVADEAANGHEVLEKLAKQDFDLLLLDMSMPRMNGVDLIKRLRREENAPPILVLSMYNEGQFAVRALKAGAAGYLSKDCDHETLLNGIRKVAGGGRLIDPALTDEIIFDVNLGDAPHLTLSDRENQIFRMILSGESLTEIATQLSLSPKTTSTYKLRLMKKLHLSNHTDLVRYGIDHGLID